MKEDDSKVRKGGTSEKEVTCECSMYWMSYGAAVDPQRPFQNLKWRNSSRPHSVPEVSVMVRENSPEFLTYHQQRCASLPTHVPTTGKEGLSFFFQ